uniref:Uncharacterized protein n=1 Tax=Anguilla anguilla TaxID=7936 RepID=A0A0E9QS43_ANGAN
MTGPNLPATGISQQRSRLCRLEA